MNNISSFAPQAQTHLQAIAGADSANVKWSHVYALMTAALGLGSRAALKAHGLVNAGHQDRDNDEDDEDMDDVSDSRAGLYWYERQQKGEVLTGVELEWAEGYVQRVQRRAAASRERAVCNSSARDHFNATAALGQHDALLLLADRYGDDRLFDLQGPQFRADPLWIADLAQRVGRYEWTLAWLELAAERGDMRAMREPMESWHADDPFKVWTWFHHPQLLGKDLAQGDYRAIHDGWVQLRRRCRWTHFRGRDGWRRTFDGG